MQIAILSVRAAAGPKGVLGGYLFIPDRKLAKNFRIPVTTSLKNTGSPYRVAGFASGVYPEP